MRVNRKNGFTLIEVVIATFIVGIALIAIVGTIQSITLQSARLEESFIANLVAQNTLSEIQLRAQWPEVGEETINSEMANRNWYSDITITATDVETLRRVVVSVGLDNDKQLTSGLITGFVSASPGIATRPVDWLKQNSGGDFPNPDQTILNPSSPRN
jgi:general secretion pathway protein I